MEALLCLNWKLVFKNRIDESVLQVGQVSALISEHAVCLYRFVSLLKAQEHVPYSLCEPGTKISVPILGLLWAFSTRITSRSFFLLHLLFGPDKSHYTLLVSALSLSPHPSVIWTFVPWKDERLNMTLRLIISMLMTLFCGNQAVFRPYKWKIIFAQSLWLYHWSDRSADCVILICFAKYIRCLKCLCSMEIQRMRR